MPMALMEVAQLPRVFLCLSSVLLFLHLGLVVLILSMFSILCSVGWGRPFLDFVVRGSQAQIAMSLF
jgi:hypothetical protein